MFNPQLDVKEMYKYYGMLNPRVSEGGKLGLDVNEKQERLAMMQEELDEYHEATNQVDEYDALLDLLVFTIGTLVQSNYPTVAGFNAVMNANMSKVVGETKRGFAKDITKPEGWQPPEPELNCILGALRMFNSPPCNDCPINGAADPNCCKFSEQPTPTNDVTQMPTGGVVKDDSGKTRYELLPWESLKQVADVFGYGAEKYFDNSWRTREAATFNRTFGSVMRHLTQWQMGQNTDPESNLNHLAHAVSQLLILMYVEQRNPDKDDRVTSKESS